MACILCDKSASLLQVNAVDIEQICKERLKIDGDEVLNPHDSPALAAAVRQLQGAAEAALQSGNDLPNLDPERDLKINQLDLVTAIRERQSLMQVDLQAALREIFPA